MCDLHIQASARERITTMAGFRRYDPTRTTALRQRFEGEAAKRLRKLRGRINAKISREDGFGLRAKRSFAFDRDSDKVEAFMEWLQEEARRGILEVAQGPANRSAGEKAWSAVYVRSAYRAGLEGSAARIRKAGGRVAPDWVEKALTQPFHADAAGLAATRTFEALKGINAELSKQIGRTLAEGLTQGDGPMKIARRINDRVDKIGITRARVLARTETIAAHAQASINTYKEAGIDEVGAEVEFLTSSDEQVCPECEGLSGQTMTLDRAQGLIPVHPNCRCAWAPIFDKEVDLR